VQYLRFLREVHAALVPPTYLEIGVHKGNSLALSRSSTIGIDPSFKLKPNVETDAALFRETSDDYFARDDPLAPFGGRPVSLAFIDGMHLIEFALRDFMNIERHSDWSSVVLFDDIFPRRPVEAARDRSTLGWTGDVYKIVDILREYRRDLICLRVGTKPTGLLLVMALDPSSDVLGERYPEIVSSVALPDPQDVPADVLGRRGALDPAAVLSGSFWSVLRQARAAGVNREQGLRQLRRAIRRDFGRAVLRPMRGYPLRMA
jgi:methyltransferase family protein